ncbi:uncharacterized protein EI90DRAFT_2857953, partial [Cantharellus anzutake]|uniref:uncharacterized protein n=1 Tax=Cantharellus anzutake TaxID=1750568 RepID=UPI0019084C23
RDYHHLLDEIEHRTVSHQFEIEKMGLPKTGKFLYLIINYKARQQIASLVAKQGKTLHTTLEKYNTLAASMNPPKLRLTWEDVTSLDFISDIVILHGCGDICDKPWAQLLFRNAMQAWFKLQQAHEEIEIIAIEATRIWTSINEEEAHLHDFFDVTRLTDPILAAYISLVFQYCLNVNSHLHAKLTQLAK